MRETARQIEEQAAVWLMRVDKDGYTPELRRELEEWLSADTRRRGAFLQAEAAWTMLDGLSLPARPAAEGDGRPVTANGVEPSSSSRRGWLAGGVLAAAASLAAVLIVPQLGHKYVTDVGEIRRLPLADGSVAAMNTATEMAVTLGKAERRVRLEEGEAWFQVAKDVSRPFLVEAGRIRVRAVGTAFSVRRQPNGAEIRVTDGIVEAWAEGAEGHRVRLRPGEQAFVGENAAIDRSAPAPSAVDRALAWRGGKIDLAGETLIEASAEFNRYNKRRIVITDPRIARERLYGVFGTDDPESFAAAVQQSLEIPVDLSREGEIRIGSTS